jgi:hypothetical protein
MEEQVMIKNFNNNDFIEEEELLAIINDFIEENVLIKLINDCVVDDIHYLRVKDNELRWLAKKTRFRAINLNK